jgi:hypothetical protein
MSKVTGTSILRNMLVSQSKRYNITHIARELNQPMDLLEAFAYGKRDIAPAMKQALARFLFAGNASFDAERDLLCSVNQQPSIPLGTAPDPCPPMKELPVNLGGAAGPRADKPAAPRRRRAGWVE